MSTWLRGFSFSSVRCSSPCARARTRARRSAAARVRTAARRQLSGPAADGGTRRDRLARGALGVDRQRRRADRCEQRQRQQQHRAAASRRHGHLSRVPPARPHAVPAAASCQQIAATNAASPPTARTRAVQSRVSSRAPAARAQRSQRCGGRRTSSVLVTHVSSRHPSAATRACSRSRRGLGRVREPRGRLLRTLARVSRHGGAPTRGVLPARQVRAWPSGGGACHGGHQRTRPVRVRRAARHAQH